MHFREYLEKNKYQPYGENYLYFDKLASMVTSEFSQTQEDKFREALENDVDRVFSFVRFKHEELEQSMVEIEKQISNGRGSSELRKVLEEMSAFSEFIRINVEGFKKILLRHDKKTRYVLIPEYRKIFKKRLDEIDGLNRLIYSASRLKLKTVDLKKEKESATQFVRKTCKYWVHPENLYALELKIVKNLPVYVYNPNPEGSPFSAWDHRKHDTCVSSVYLDNSRFEVYTERLHKNQGSEAIRIRWYGSTVPSIVFIERKRHEDGWTGHESNKTRFKIPEKYVIDFLNGLNVWEHVKMLNGSGVFDLYKETQTAIMVHKLRPSLRTFYKRTAFQLPNDSSVRISLDTNLVMIRERTPNENDGDPIRQWRRPDATSEWPFKNLPRQDVIRFPYAVLEIKTQGVDETKPEWIEELVNSSYLEFVHKYSKFMHGTALLNKHVELIPYWLPQMKTDIRKDPFHPIKEHKIIENNVLLTQSGAGDNSSEGLSPVLDHGKKIAVPVRVEPKVFLANERTFLKWIQFSIFLGGVGTSVLGFGDNNAALCGSMLMIVSLCFVGYAFYTFRWRNEKIRIRFPGPYDDLIGPTILVLVFLAVLVLSVVFKYPATISADDMI